MHYGILKEKTCFKSFQRINTRFLCSQCHRKRSKFSAKKIGARHRYLGILLLGQHILESKRLVCIFIKLYDLSFVPLAIISIYSLKLYFLYLCLPVISFKTPTFSNFLTSSFAASFEIFNFPETSLTFTNGV